MGQYYRCLLTDANGKMVAYNRSVDGEYQMAKLMEHSWWSNIFVGTICNKLYMSPHRVAWVGDYAFGTEELDFDQRKLGRICGAAWSGDGYEVKFAPLSLDYAYLVNHSKKQYVDSIDYKKKSRGTGDDADWIIHPLPLLTAIGNGLGLGDYNCPSEDSTVDLVGSWADDIIEVVKYENIPEGYEKLNCVFKERV